MEKLGNKFVFCVIIIINDDLHNRKNQSVNSRIFIIYYKFINSEWLLVELSTFLATCCAKGKKIIFI